MSPGSVPTKCERCGRDPAPGFATITKGEEDLRYCHGDDPVTCYMQANRSLGIVDTKQP